MNYQTNKAWPYVEARKIAERNITGRPVVFETGYGPSGQPHLGTLAEVVRTTMVRHAYEDLMGYDRHENTRLIVFSDDMDALRKVPDNVPNRDMMERYIGYSLTRVPDPFGQHESFAHHNNAMLRRFLDSFGFDYEFMSATQSYESGKFDEALSLMAREYQKVHSVILPTLGEERRASYCCFMPRLPDGRIVSDGVTFDPEYETLVNFSDDIGNITYDVRRGNGKMQWKADWALRWIALGVDYEMAGKDLIDSVKLSSAIVRRLGHRPPVNMIYEMFLDENGEKISKSKGNGLSVDEWFSYGSRESLYHYLYREPQRAKKLYPGVVVQAMDDYYDARARYIGQTPDERLGNGVHHVHDGDVPPDTLPVTYQLLLNLAGTASIDSADMLAGYVEKAFPVQNPIVANEMREMIEKAATYHIEQRRDNLVYRTPTDMEANAFVNLANEIERQIVESGVPLTDEAIQFLVYEVGKTHFGKENLREWFKALYQCLLGQDSGPRFGAFAVLYGIDETIALLRNRAAER